MSRRDLKFALNAIQWINVKEDPNDPNSADLWRFADPSFVADYPDVLGQIKAAGFDTTMLEVLDTQTLQNYKAMVDAAGLQLSPGYVEVPLPSDHGGQLARGSYERAHWFDHARRRAEESNYFGLDTIFVSAEVNQTPSGVRFNERAAVGYDFRQDRLDEFVEYLIETCEVLKAEGIRSGLHNHVGTWVETEAEIEYVLGQVDSSLLGASFDIGHLEWAGIDSPSYLSKWSDRLMDLHIKDLNLAVARSARENPVPYNVSTNRGLFLEPGLGQIDLPGVLNALPEAFDGWVLIEVDRASMNPGESAAVSAEWMRRVKAGEL
ncbi:2-keto-myo-inositol dehydratase [Microterricola gilva]|uniref:2-keto-myo-inositol dehydratase n=1 Tax=Microterricola gilva TaxID=393267 RepID=A0A4Q8APB2_9MICO|nr:sugar phosphate isomerase/epimerase [Microterricola gilva]RZU66522.1 2-keto-myo-inositol dehydratase [Microterricola gilva]